MAKSLRSKIKRKFRTELRQRIGVPHKEIQEAKIQDNMRKAIESQTSGSSMMGLKQLMGTTNAPVAVHDESMEVDEKPVITAKEAKKILREQQKKKNQTKKRKKSLQFYPLRKKGTF